jgi:glutathione S-transferase
MAGDHEMKLSLIYAPFTCASVSLIALEEIGVPFDVELVDLARGQHYEPDVFSRFPKAKVPVLTVNGQVLTETPVILSWLAANFPAAQLLPAPDGLMARMQVLSDLCYCSGTVHPIVTRIARAQFLCDDSAGAQSVFGLASKAIQPQFSLIEKRLSEAPWWYGDRFSMMDPYLNWIWQRVTSTSFDASGFPAFASHAEHVSARPSVVRAAERAKAAIATLAQPAVHPASQLP